jgi:hypothetical protein
LDLGSFTRWDEYTQAHDDMLFIAQSDDKRRVRLNIISTYWRIFRTLRSLRSSGLWDAAAVNEVAIISASRSV